MFAVIKTGGKQYVVRPGDKIKIEKLEIPEGEEVFFDALMVSDKETLVGAPFVKGYKVKAKIIGGGKGKKIIVYKYKAKKRYHKKQGHRQLFTEIEILSISVKGESGEAKKTTAKAATGGTAKSAPKRATPATKEKASTTKKKATVGEKRKNK